MCPEKGLHFRYFNLSLGHFYTLNTWNSQKKLLHIVLYGKYLSFAPLVTPITVLGAEQFAFPWNFFFAGLQLKKFWAWAKTKTGLCWGRITAKASDEFQRYLIFNREDTKQKHQFYRVSDKLKVMFLFCGFSIKDQISLKLVRWAK